MRFRTRSSWLGIFVAILLACPNARAWDYELHRLIHQIALASLPTNFPAFTLTPEARERIAFLSGEPDRWRNTADTPLRHANGPEHYFDVDDLPDLGLKPAELSHFREQFILQVHAGRNAHPERFPKIDPLKDPDHVKWFPGLLPWRITEDYARLKSAFSYLKTLEKDGDPAEVENARANVVHFMGVMGHFLGDACQLLHTTHHFNGWTGENPMGYTTNKTFHAWVDGNFLKKVGYNPAAVIERVRPAKLAWDGDPQKPRDHLFPVALDYVQRQFERVEPLYQLEKDGKLGPDSTKATEGREFIVRQLLEGGQMLGDLWYSAWVQAGPDTFLQVYLARRKLERAAAPK